MAVTDAPFQQLRYAYLRAIALMWDNQKACEKIPNISRAGNGLYYLEHHFHFTFPWDINFQMFANDDKRPTWSPELGLEWWKDVSPDEFVVPLPERPSAPKRTWARYLANYGLLFPSMLGRSGLPAKNEDGKPLLDHNNKPILRPYAEAPAEFGVLGILTLRVIAAIWKDGELAEKLLTASSMETVQMLENWFGYVFPWNFGLRFFTYPLFNGELGDPPSLDTGIEDVEQWLGERLVSYPRSTVTVNIPQNPLRQEESLSLGDDEDNAYLIQPIALAAYNGNGDAYPFSCS